MRSRVIEVLRRGLRVLYRVGSGARSSLAQGAHGSGLRVSPQALPPNWRDPAHGYDDRTSSLLSYAMDSEGIPRAVERADPELVHDLFRLRGVASLSARWIAEDRSSGSELLLESIVRRVADHAGQKSGVAWDTTTACLRLLSLLSAAETLKPTGRRLPGWDEWLRAFIESHAWPLEYGRYCEPAGNHRFLNVAGVAALQLLLNDSPLPLRLVAKVSAAASSQFLPDGGHRERTPHYHVQTLSLMTLIARADAARGGDLSTALRATLDPAKDALGLMITPDNELLRFGDAGPTFSGRPAAVEAQELLRGRTRVATGALHDFGLVSRSWLAGRSELYLHADVGPHGIGDGCGHAHADALSYVLFRDGVPLVTDPGTFVYDDAPTARWFKLPEAHNAVHWPDHPPYQLRRFFHWSRFPAPPGFAVPAGNKGLLCAATQRWRVRGATVSARRTWHGTADGLTVTDEFTSSIAAPVELTLSFAPGEVLVRTATGVRLERAGTEISISSPGGATVEIDARPHAPRYGSLTVVPALVVRGQSTPDGASIVTRYTVL